MRHIITSSILGTVLLGVVGCQNEGEKAQEAVSKATEAANEATEQAKKMMEQAQRVVDQGVVQANDAVKSTQDQMKQMQAQMPPIAGGPSAPALDDMAEDDSGEESPEEDEKMN